MSSRTLLLALVAFLILPAAAWATDSDSDGLSNSLETALGTDPNDSDTDDDGVTDFDELIDGTDPLLDDTDGDGQTDGYEIAHSTDPLDPGTDLDGVNAASFSAAPSTNDLPLHGNLPTDGVGVSMVDGHFVFSALVGETKAVLLRMGLEVFYNSAWAWDGYEGWNFASNLDARLTVHSPTTLTIWRPPFGALNWTKVGSDWTSDDGSLNTLSQSGGSFTETTPGGFKYHYSSGHLTSMEDKYGNATTVGYSGATPTTITDSRGEVHNLAYWTSTGRLKSITMADGRVWYFRYSVNGDLMRIEGPATASFPNRCCQPRHRWKPSFVSPT